MRVLSVWKAMAMMSHISPGVLAEVLRQAVGGAFHGKDGLAVVRPPLLGPLGD